jgi:hypothetical protein
VGAVERLGGKKSDVVGSQDICCRGCISALTFAGPLKATYKVLTAGTAGEREDSIAIGNVYCEFFGHETVRPQGLRDA